MYFKIYAHRFSDESRKPMYSAELINGDEIVSASQPFDNECDAIVEATNNFLCDEEAADVAEAVFNAGVAHGLAQPKETDGGN